MRRIFHRPSPAMVVAFIALVAATAPTAAALTGTNIVSSNDIINGAVKKQDAGRDSIGTNEAREDNDDGGGFTGQQINEATLDTVPRSASLATHALVNGTNGAFVRGRGVRSTRKTGTGSYEVLFEREVGNCTYAATLDGNAAGQVSAQAATGNANGVNVSTFDPTGAAADRSFHLAVNC
jgi:hypothetical protein